MLNILNVLTTRFSARGSSCLAREIRLLQRKKLLNSSLKVRKPAMIRTGDFFRFSVYEKRSSHAPVLNQGHSSGVVSASVLDVS